MKDAEATAQAAKGTHAFKEAGEASPIGLGKFVGREQGTGPGEAPEQEPFDGWFTPGEARRMGAGKLGGATAEVGCGRMWVFQGVGHGDAGGRGAVRGGFLAEEGVREGRAVGTRGQRIGAVPG